jgi:molybdate transport system substrate-binding protein
MNYREGLTVAVLALALAACSGEAPAPAANEAAEAEAPAAEPAPPAEIRVLTVGGTRIAMEALQQQYEAMSDNTLTISFNNPAMIEQLMVEEDFDVIVAAITSVNAAADMSLLEPGTQQRFARTGIGLSVRTGAELPDISTPEGFRNTLLAANSIAISNPEGYNGSGVQTVRILGYVGVYDEVMAKATIQGLAEGKELIAAGERDLGLFNVSEATGEGITYVGPVPPVWQLYTNYDVAIFADSAVKAQAADLIAFLTSPEAEAGWNAGGIEFIPE